MIVSGQMTEMQPTNYTKRLMTFDMLNRGVGFFISSEALNDPIQGFVKSHLLCQSIECFLKGLLLLKNYDKFQPEIRGIGHDLLKLLEITENVYHHNIPQTYKNEIIILNNFYKKHMLRYGGPISIFNRSSEFSRSNVQRYMRKLISICYNRNERDFQELFSFLK